MILRYTVEGEFAATFTAKKNVKDEAEALRIIISLGFSNVKAGYKKYSMPRLYDDNNKKIKDLTL